MGWSFIWKHVCGVKQVYPRYSVIASYIKLHSDVLVIGWKLEPRTRGWSWDSTHKWNWEYDSRSNGMWQGHHYSLQCSSNSFVASKAPYKPCAVKTGSNFCSLIGGDLTKHIIFLNCYLEGVPQNGMPIRAGKMALLKTKFVLVIPSWYMEFFLVKRLEQICTLGKAHGLELYPDTSKPFSLYLFVFWRISPGIRPLGSYVVGEILLYLYVPMFPWKDFLMG